MILRGGSRSFTSLQHEQYDAFIYGLGFETRSTTIAAMLTPKTKLFALKMPVMKIHSYDRNLKFANQRNHIIIEDFASFLTEALPKIFERRASGNLKIGFDVSSLNRIMLADTLTQFARLCRPSDVIEIFYCPAAYTEPSWVFPQIEKLGPINSTFSIIDTDASKPLCLLFGAGFEAGISMGMISQLEPRASFCLWGTGVDTRFDRAVRKANFNFEFDGFNTKTLSYNIRDPLASYQQLESLVFGLIQDYRVIIIPMGPKLFAFLTVLVGMNYLGRIAVWRVQYTRSDPPDSRPSTNCVSCVLDTHTFSEFAAREQSVLQPALFA